MTILVLDDDSAIRECLKIQLEVLGHIVWEERDLTGYHTRLRFYGLPDAAIIDGHFPWKTGDAPEPLGMSVLQALLRGGVHAILFTGDDKLLLEARRLGVPAVGKPGKIAEIMAEIGCVSGAVPRHGGRP